MRIKVAGTAGFCWGVQRALRMIDSAAADGKKTVTLGPLVHNTPLRERFQERRIGLIEKVEQAATEDRVVLRPHGTTQDDMASLGGRGSDVLDATCPHILDTKATIGRLAKNGRNILVAGNREHEEVKFLLDGLSTKSWVVGSSEEVAEIAAETPLVLVSQSTFGPALFEDIAEAVGERWKGTEVLATRCCATEDRQEETATLAAEADVLVIVGAYHSGNARRLAEMCRDSGKQTFHVETPEDIAVPSLVEQARLSRRQALMEKFADDPDALREATSDPGRLDAEVLIGVTAGASTPPWILQSVVDHLAANTGGTVEKGLPRDLAEEASAGGASGTAV